MNRKLCVSKKIPGFSGRLDYYLLEKRYEDIKDGISTYVFGVEIEKLSLDEFNVEYIQRKKVSDLSVLREKVLEFLYMLSENDVMPVSLVDIAQDYVEQGFFNEPEKAKKTA